MLFTTLNDEEEKELWRLQHGYVTRALIDEAITALGPEGSNELEWKPAAPPPEDLGTVEDGLQRLPLDTTPSREHSIAHRPR